MLKCLTAHLYQLLNRSEKLVKVAKNIKRVGVLMLLTHLTTSQAPKKSPQEEADDAVDSLYEPEWKKTLVDANAVLVMSVAIFFWGFYA